MRRALAVTLVLGRAASAQEMLWDNAIYERCGTAISSERDTLVADSVSIDDFLLGAPGAIVSEVHTVFLVGTPDGSDDPPGGFTSAEVFFYPINHQTGGPDCHNPFHSVLARPVDVLETGFDGFGLLGWIVRTDGMNVALPEGHYFVGPRLVDDGSGRAFIYNTRCRDEVVLSQAYLHSQHFEADCDPGIIHKGMEYDIAFRIFGFVPGVATDAYLHRVTPIRVHGEVQGGRNDIAESDDKYLVLTAAHGASLSRYHTASVLFESTFPTKPLLRMDVRVESGTTKPRVAQEIRLLDFDTGRYVTLDARPLPFDDTVVTIEDLPDPGRFIGPDGGVELVIEAYAPGQSIAPHELRIDEVKVVLTYEPF